MKRFWVLGLALALCLLGSLGAQAQVSIDASYLISAPCTLTYPNEKDTATVDGWFLTADAGIAGPWGVQVRYASVDGRDFESDGEPLPGWLKASMSYDRTDALLSYAFPSGDSGTQFKLLAGYAWPKWTLGADGGEVAGKDTWDFSGLVIGGDAAFKASDNLKLGASLLYAPSLAFDWTQKVNGISDSYSGTGNSLDYVLQAEWEYMPNFGVQAGYRGTTLNFTCDGYDFEYSHKFSGFFLGASATF